jgi:hypothetical protein
MSEYNILSETVVAQAIGDTSTTQLVPLGLIVEALDTASTQYGVGQFIYAKGCASTVVGSVALINSDDFVTSLAVAGDKGQIGLSMSINVANQYGWYQIGGKGVAKVLTGFADNATCYLTSTAGSIDDAAVTGDLIINMKGASATGTPSTGLAEIELLIPSVSQASGVTLGDLGVTASAADLNATTNFEETVSATTSEVTIKTAKTLNIVDNGGLKIASTAILATAAEINRSSDTSTRVVTLSGSTSITEALHDKKILLMTGTGSAFTQTLPAATGSGSVFEFVVGAVNTSNHIIKVTGDDVMYGQLITCSTGDTPDLAQPWITAADSDTITLNGTTTGGLAVGDRIIIEDVAADKWVVSGFTTSSGAEATPFSATV